MENLRLIVGLGNPGAEYARTRHNAGFLVVDQLASRWKQVWRTERKFDAQVARTTVGPDVQIVLCKPQTFMNASGEAVRPLAAFYRVTAAGCLVVVDDADLPFGELRLRLRGSSGGHHGLESIEQHLGTRDFPRLRVGIGRQSTVRQITGHVLGRFATADEPLLAAVLSRAADQAECWAVEGGLKAMNQFNGTVACPTNEGKEQ